MTEASNPVIQRFLTRTRLRSYPARSVIVHAADDNDNLWYIVEGSVAVSITNAEGQELVLSYLGQGEFFGETGLFETGVPGAEVITRTPATIAQISHEAFRKLIEEDSAILFELSRQMAERLRKTSRKVARQTFVDVTSRIAYALLDLAKQPEAMTHPDGMLVKISRQELARLVGCSREMAGRAVAALEEKGFVHAKGKSIVVLGVTCNRLGASPLGQGSNAPDDSLIGLPILGKGGDK
jgi:CRP/FNR family cyclic AMP-dependent transcriptional regulator